MLQMDTRSSSSSRINHLICLHPPQMHLSCRDTSRYIMLFGVISSYSMPLEKL